MTQSTERGQGVSRKRHQKRYTDNDRARTLAALQANNGNITRTSRDTGVSASTIRHWRDNTSETVAATRDQKVATLAEELETLAYKLAWALPERIEGANLGQVTTSLGIVIDKLQLLQGQPTEITKNETHRVETPERALKAAATALERRGLLN